MFLTGFVFMTSFLSIPEIACASQTSSKPLLGSPDDLLHLLLGHELTIHRQHAHAAAAETGRTVEDKGAARRLSYGR
jgi:hypothetical protein